MHVVPHSEREVAAMAAFLRSQLGYKSDNVGSLTKQVEENSQMIRSMEATLRGRDDELGLIGWLMVIRRTWIALVALLGAAFGYALNDVVHTLEGRLDLSPPAVTDSR